MICELCQSIMRQGSWGQKAWICTNNECERSNPIWKTPAEKEIQRLLFENNGKIGELSKVIIRDQKAVIQPHSVRWAGEGSGTIEFDNGGRVTYMKNNGKYEYSTEDEELLSQMKKSDFEKTLDELRYLSVERLSEILP